MRRYVAGIVGVLVLAAAGFAAAGIVNGGSLAASLQGSNETTTGVTGPTGRRVTICHRTHSKKHPAVTITVDQHAVPAHLRHGDHLGPCRGDEKPLGAQTKGKKGKKQGGKGRSGAPAAGSDQGNNGNNGNNGNGGSSGHGKKK